MVIMKTFISYFRSNLYSTVIKHKILYGSLHSLKFEDFEITVPRADLFFGWGWPRRTCLINLCRFYTIAVQTHFQPTVVAQATLTKIHFFFFFLSCCKTIHLHTYRYSTVHSTVSLSIETIKA